MFDNPFSIILTIFGVLILTMMLANQGRANNLPEGFGIAGKYPGDIGISDDPSVLFAEDFERDSIESIARHWGEISNDEIMTLSEDVPRNSSGKRSIRMTAILGENTGGHLYTLFPRGVDTAFARFYVKFPADAGYIHHFVHLGGYNPPTRWPQGGAGERPRGDDRVTVGIEPYGSYGRYPAPGAWNFYTYWHDMKISADGKYWGNGLHPVEPAFVPKDRWQCVEIMLKLNSSPDLYDGELALWLDGKLIAHFARGVRRSNWTGMGFSLLADEGEPFEGFRWRTSSDLKINFFWLLHYVTENSIRQNKSSFFSLNRTMSCLGSLSKKPEVNSVWFDDVVVSTEYIGPIKKNE